MLIGKYAIQWAGRCQFDDSDKVWGWFICVDPYTYDPKQKVSPRNRVPDAYTFWARTGKTPSFKKHDNNSRELERLVEQKKSRKYVELTEKELLEIWPNLLEDLENKFTYHLLADNFK